METVQRRTCILNQQAIAHKIKRIALQIAEQNIEEKELVIAGINGNGQLVSTLLAGELVHAHPFQTHIITVRVNKKEPLAVSLSEDLDFNNKVVILVDDVVNTGRIMLYALKPFLNAHPKKIQTVVLVERSHKLFPVKVDYTGLSIATTLQEHIAVETEGEEISGAWLY